MNFQELVRRAKSGDEAAYAQLYKLTVNRAHFTASTMLRDAQDAQDAVQDSYVLAFRNLDMLKDAASFEPWLRRIVANRCKDMMRQKRPFLFEDTVQEQQILGGVEEPDDNFLPQSYLENDLRREQVMEILDELSPVQRSTLLLYYYDELTLREIAQLMECSENTVTSRIRYAKKYVKQEIERLEQKGNWVFAMIPMPFFTELFLKEAAVHTLTDGVSQQMLSGVLLSANAPVTGIGAKIAALSAGTKAVAITAATSIVVTTGAAVSIMTHPAAPAASADAAHSASIAHHASEAASAGAFVVPEACEKESIIFTMPYQKAYRDFMLRDRALINDVDPWFSLVWLGGEIPVLSEHDGAGISYYIYADGELQTISKHVSWPESVAYYRNNLTGEVIACQSYAQDKPISLAVISLEANKLVPNLVYWCDSGEKPRYYTEINSVITEINAARYYEIGQEFQRDYTYIGRSDVAVTLSHWENGKPIAENIDEFLKAGEREARANLFLQSESMRGLD